jgi:nitroreductase
MELYDVMRTTFSAREFTADPLPDDTLFKILNVARFAPSGGNRQGWRVLVVRDRATREAIAELNAPTAKRYMAQVHAGENPWNTIDPTTVDAVTIEQTRVPSRMTEPLLKAPVVLVICVDLKVIASTDQYLRRVGVVSGASIYPFAWSILLAARHEGFGGTSPRWQSRRNRSCRRCWASPRTSPYARSSRSAGRCASSGGSSARPCPNLQRSNAGAARR